MAISNVKVVNTASKYIVKSKGIGSETDQVLVNANDLTGGTYKSLVSLIECYYIIESIGSIEGKLTISAAVDAEYDEQAEAAGTQVRKDLVLTGNGKYGLRPSQLKFGNDKIFKLTTDSNVRNYLLVTEFRRESNG